SHSEHIPLIALEPAKIHVGCNGFAAPLNEPDPVPKNRYLSFVSGSSCIQTAHRVTFDSLPPPNDVLNGKTMWLGPPAARSEASGTTGPEPEPAVTVSYLQCAPHYADFGELDTVHAYHKGIIPNGVYTIQATKEGCPVEDEGCYTSGLTLTTSMWGDVVGDCEGNACSAPNGVTDFRDITALVDKFKNVPGAVSKPRGDIGDEIPDGRVDFLDTGLAVHSFRGAGYPFVVPGAADCE
ncbi:MAG: hypothetical protein PVI86_13565, partial [Phycisphaerae bacterium]